VFLILFALATALAGTLPDVQVGDIVFQESTSSQSAQIQAATNSRYSHVAIVVSVAGHPVVLEAVQPVKLTPLSEWVDRGVDDHIAVRRPAVPLTDAQRGAIATMGLPWLGRNYDARFRWDDDRLYCSELVYKLYEQATGIEVGSKRAVAEFHVDSPNMLAALEKRGIALDQLVVSPADILNDSDLIEVAPQ